MFSKSNIHLQPVGWLKTQVSDDTPSLAINPIRDLLTSTLLLTPKRFLEGCVRTALTGAAAVGGHHHCVDPLVLDNVLPVDGVSVTQELVLVDVHASAQDLCGEREKDRRVFLFHLWNRWKLRATTWLLSRTPGQRHGIIACDCNLWSFSRRVVVLAPKSLLSCAVSCPNQLCLIPVTTLNPTRLKPPW